MLILFVQNSISYPRNISKTFLGINYLDIVYIFVRWEYKVFNAKDIETYLKTTSFLIHFKCI